MSGGTATRVDVTAEVITISTAPIVTAQTSHTSHREIIAIEILQGLVVCQVLDLAGNVESARICLESAVSTFSLVTAIKTIN